MVEDVQRPVDNLDVPAGVGVGAEVEQHLLVVVDIHIVVDDDDLGAHMAPTINGLIQDKERLQAMEAAAENKGNSLKVLGVTVLTSLDRGDLDDLGFACDVGDLVLSRARQCLESGCDGVISSGLEVPALREFVDEVLEAFDLGLGQLKAIHELGAGLGASQLRGEDCTAGCAQALGQVTHGPSGGGAGSLRWCSCKRNLDWWIRRNL